jgi:protein SCO1/2
MVCWAAAGCSRERAAATPKPEPGYPLQGEIVSVDAARNVLVVRHEDIPGLMPAMTMEFAVAPGDAAIAKPGQRIRARLIKVEQGDWRLEHIWPADAAVTTEVETQAKALRQDTLTRGSHAYRDTGEQIPEFSLYDQDGRVVRSGQFRGQRIMLNFIYTRCPVANMCPLSTAKMAQTQKLARAAGVKDFQLISITLDPKYDTPGVLKTYASSRGIDTTNFSFLTGPESAIKDLLAQFGVLAEFEGDLVKHTLTTLLIDENGRIVHRADGSNWEPKEFVAKLTGKSRS